MSDLRHPFIAAALALATGSILTYPARGAMHGPDVAPSAAEASAATAEQLVHHESFTRLDFSPDGTRLLLGGTVAGIERPLEIEIATGAKRFLTPSSQVGQAQGHLPGGALLVSVARDGTEINHLYVLQRSGQARDLFPQARGTVDFQGWSFNHQSFFVGVNDTASGYFNLYEVNGRTLDCHLLMPGGDYRLNRPGLGDFVAVSSDRSLVAIERASSNVRSDVVLHDVIRGTDSDLTTSSGSVINRPLSFAPGGHTLYYATDRDGEYAELVAAEIGTGNSHVVIRVAADVQYLVFSSNGRYAAVGLSANGRTDLVVYSLPEWKRVSLSGLPAGVTRITAFEPHERALALVVRTPTTPGDIYIVSLPSGRARMLESAWPSGRSERPLVGATMRSFTSYDGRSVSGVLYLPADDRVGKSRKAMVWAHGGPAGQAELDYQPLLQFLALQGYAVFAVNYRGSTGYGKSFARLAARHHGEGDVKDLIAARDAVAEWAHVERGHVAVGGGSFGGYLTLAAITSAPKAFGGAVDMFGIADWNRVLRSTPKSWASRRIVLTSEIGDPDEDSGAYLSSISPINKLDRISVPIFVLQGINDPRVPRAESDDVVAAARRAGVPVDYLLLEHEGHDWPHGESNQVLALERMGKFLEEHL